MSEICHVGFFNLNSNCSGFNPIDLLKRALDECDQKDLFAQSLIVLPEALNIVEGYYPAPHLDTNRKCVDLEVEKKLIALSEELRLCFVVGLISSTSTGRAGYSEAVLIDARFRKVLSKKTLCDGSPCYTPFEQSPEEIGRAHV